MIAQMIKTQCCGDPHRSNTKGFELTDQSTGKKLPRPDAYAHCRCGGERDMGKPAVAPGHPGNSWLLGGTWCREGNGIQAGIDTAGK